MRVGLVCPYSWDIPGGVQAHVRDLADTLIALGHEVSVLAPGDEDQDGLPSYVVAAGKAVPIPYNGSVARLQFGPVSAARVRRWLRDGQFDVVHVHEPAPPSLSLLACILGSGPMVATFHSATTRSRMLSTVDGMLQPFLEKLSGRIAVSPAARKVIVEHLGGDAIVIPNGVSVAHYAQAEPLPGYPLPGGSIGFIGRYDEPRKGMDVLVDAFGQLLQSRPETRLVIAGRGDEAQFLAALPPRIAAQVDMLGQVSELDKARLLRSVDVYCAPNTGGESFGIILLEAMAAGAPIVASDLPAFQAVLAGGEGGLLTPVAQPQLLAVALQSLLDDPARRAGFSARGVAIAAAYDWSVVAAQILRVYEVAVSAA